MPKIVGVIESAFSLGVERGSPDLAPFANAQGITAFSDYSGREGTWRTAAFLFVPSELVGSFDETLARVRNEHGITDDRRVEFKSLRDRARWRMLPAWLSSFDTLPGLAFVITAHSDVVSAIRRNHPTELAEQAGEIAKLGLGDWSLTRSGPRLLEEALRLAHGVAYVFSFLAGGRNIPFKWISDNDEVFAGDIRAASTRSILRHALEKYCGRRVAHDLVLESEIVVPSERHLLSIPDLLAAGVLEHQLGTDAGDKEAIAKSAAIMSWIGQVDQLQKLCVRLRADSTDGFRWESYRPSFAPSAL
jgi:hypothetical protein